MDKLHILYTLDFITIIIYVIVISKIAEGGIISPYLEIAVCSSVLVLFLIHFGYVGLVYFLKRRENEKGEPDNVRKK